jgi:hypothetical protein
MAPKLKRFAVALTPALVCLLGALLIAYLLGGVIAVVLAGALLIAALLVNCLLLWPLVGLTAIGKRYQLLLAGSGAYLAACLLILLLWGLSGPTQIM